MRTVFTGGRVFDGTGAAVAEADVVVEDGLIVEVGAGLDGDEQVDVAGRDAAARAVRLPRPRDVRPRRHLAAPADAVLVPLLRRDQEPRRDAPRRASRRSATRAAPTSASSRRVEEGIVARAAHADLDHDAQPDRRPRRRLDAVRRLACRSFVRLPGHAVGHRRRPRRDAAQGPRADPRRRRRDQGGHLAAACSSPRDDPRHAHFRPTSSGAWSRRRRPPVSGSWPTPRSTGGIKNAVRAGVRSIEHGIFLDDEAIELMLEHGTLPRADPGRPDRRARGGRRRGADPRHVRRARPTRSSRRTATRSGGRSRPGVKVAMGTDTGVTPHGDNLRRARSSWPRAACRRRTSWSRPP